jgi:hypothetical protein
MKGMSNCEPGCGYPAGGEATSAANWLSDHEMQLIECDRHNGRVRLTVGACAERYRRARDGWLKACKMSPDRKYLLRMSLEACATCPVGARHAKMARLRSQAAGAGLEEGAPRNVHSGLH